MFSCTGLGSLRTNGRSRPCRAAAPPRMKRSDSPLGRGKGRQALGWVIAGGQRNPPGAPVKASQAFTPCDGGDFHRRNMDSTFFTVVAIMAVVVQSYLLLLFFFEPGLRYKVWNPPAPNSPEFLNMLQALLGVCTIVRATSTYPDKWQRLLRERADRHSCGAKEHQP